MVQVIYIVNSLFSYLWKFPLLSLGSETRALVRVIPLVPVAPAKANDRSNLHPILFLLCNFSCPLSEAFQSY